MNEQQSNVSIPGFSQPEANRLAGGQPSEAQLREAAKHGLRRIINLRPPAEDHGFDESAATCDCCVEYNCLPIAGPADLTRENVQRFDELLKQAGNDYTLIHCASGNRVGALMALRAAWIEGKPTADALAIGRKWGLTKMEPMVAGMLNS